ncbi:hypothetical protein Mgra_00005468 [Meloidogyne graminicola]|uniref:Copper transport protein n=1 Tax=Meloidogyne graminicola TaxID=189291 RepID=A0A8S9ZPQ3_9BILA|nr:hypothetical protein Mgra_00005468 [Meloidogyne graminicola]
MNTEDPSIHNHNNHIEHNHSKDNIIKVSNMFHSMAMYFHFGSKESILFSFWNTESTLGIFCSCLIIFFACFCLELTRLFRVYQKKKLLNGQRDENLSTNDLNIGFSSMRRPDLGNLFDMCLHAIQLTLSYMLMMIFMTFNVWLCFSVVFGEVLARMVISLFFPSMDLFVTFFGSSIKPCCG